VAIGTSVGETRLNENAGDRARRGTRGQDDRARGGVLIPVDGDPGLPGKPGRPVDDGHAVALEQPAYSAGEPLDDLPATGHDRFEVDHRLTDVHAQLGGFARLRDDVRRAQHQLGGDAGVVEAAPTEAVALDHGGAHAELSRADRRHIAARSGADDDAVELGHDPFQRHSRRGT
jgi:hypothetical protein